MSSLKAILCLIGLLVAAWGRTAPVAATGRKARFGTALRARAADFDIRKPLLPAARRSAKGGPAPTARQAAGLPRAEMAARFGQGVRFAFSESGLPKYIFGDGAPLSSPSTKDPVGIARDFLRTHRAVFRFSDAEVDQMALDSRVQDRGATVLSFHQTIGGIPVFQGLVKMTIDGEGRVVHVNLGSVVPQSSLDTRPSLDPIRAVKAAIRAAGVKGEPTLRGLPGTANGGARFANPFAPRNTPVTAGLAVFPMPPGPARLAYRIYVEVGRLAWYEILLDATDGRLLSRRNLYHPAGKARVWTQSPLSGSRQLVDLPSAWLPPQVEVTTGNNVDAYLDTDGDDSPDPYDEPHTQAGRAFAPTQVFDFPAGEGTTKQDPRDFKAASVTNLFYLVNVAHDYFYGLGFDEAAGNFQTLNFGKGGQEGDAVRAEAQDPFTDNAQFALAPDGTPPRLQVGLISSDTHKNTDDYDGSYDAQLVVHEYAHGVAERLAGGPNEASCLLGTVQAMALTEGWSDYFAVSFSGNPVLGAYWGRNAVHGARRQSYQNYTFTYEDFGNSGLNSHDDGELWAAALWDLRASLGQNVADQLVMGGLKSTPCNPTMVEARDAILAADQSANAGAHRQQIWQVFAQHGLGNSAGAVDNVQGGALVFDAAYDLPLDLQPGNHNPRVDSSPPDIAAMGDQLVYQVHGVDADGDKLTYQLTEGPAGAVIDAATGRLEWTANFTAERVRVTVTDGKGGKVVHGFLVPVVTPLSVDAPLNISGKANSVGIAYFDTPAETQVLQVKLRGATGDADLGLATPSLFYGFSARTGSNETLSAADPAAGTWWTYVFGYEDYSGVTLAVGFPVPELVAINSTLENLSDTETGERFFKVVVPDTAATLRVETSGGSGDVDMYIRKGAVGVCSSYMAPCEADDFSGRSGNQESIEVKPVEPGDWYITLNAYETYWGATMNVTVTGPEFTSDGVVNAASFSKVVAPGGIFSIFGSNFSKEEFVAGATPLPTTLGVTGVKVNGIAAPLFYVGPSQINAQMPVEILAGEASVEVSLGDLVSSAVKVTVLPTGPGIFQWGTGRAVVQNEDGSINDTGKPARVGSAIVAYLTGLGPLDNPVATGQAAPISPWSQSTSTFSATIGSKPAQVFFLGLTPTFVGLAQANLIVPDLAAGDYPLQITVGGVASNAPVITVAAP